MQKIITVLTQVVTEQFGQQVAIELTRPEEQFGDYATNVALQLARAAGQSPRVIAETIVAAAQPKLTDVCAALTIAGPGFINFRLSDAYLCQVAASATEPAPRANKTVLVEYSDPNPLKPLHAGHLYTTVVGDAIARLVEHRGNTTVRLNYGGDVGLHVGKSMWAIVQALGGEFPDKLADITPAERPQWLGQRYVEGNHAYEDDETAKQAIVAANKRVYTVHAQNDHDSPFAQIYWTVRQWSYDYFAELYQQLGVVPFDRFIPESQVTPVGLQTVHEQLAAGVYRQSDGAVVFGGDDHGLHTRVFINSEGLPTYEAKEVGLLLTKWQDYHFDQSIVITANEQDQYMQVVFKSIEQYLPEPILRTRHITHGIVKLQGGVKMSSRKGNIVSALDILTAAREAGQQSGLNPAEDTILAAVKYAMLRPRIGADVIYDPKESIALEGNSGPYLQYAHARACSIASKSTQAAAMPADFEPAERTLARKIAEYPEVVAKAAEELLPHHICTYLYELAQTFNRFYEHNRVIGDPREPQRLWLVARYTAVLKDGLHLLGIHAPNKM